MSTPAASGADAQRGPAAKLGLHAGQLVQSLDADGLADAGLLGDVTALTGEELVPAGSDDVVDVVLLWFRDLEGGDVDGLVDVLVDARRNLADAGVVWLMTPKSGREGHVEPSDIQEAVPTAGLAVTSTLSAAPAWTGSRLVAPKTARSARR